MPAVSGDDRGMRLRLALGAALKFFDGPIEDFALHFFAFAVARVQMLRQMSCDQAQGYFYSRPLKLADMQNFSLRNLLEHPHRSNAIPPHRDSRQFALSAMGSIA